MADVKWDVSRPPLSGDGNAQKKRARTHKRTRGRTNAFLTSHARMSYLRAQAGEYEMFVCYDRARNRNAELWGGQLEGGGDKASSRG